MPYDTGNRSGITKNASESQKMMKLLFHHLLFYWTLKRAHWFDGYK